MRKSFGGTVMDMGYGRRQETQRRLKKVYQVGKYGVDYDERRGYYCFSPRPPGTMRLLRKLSRKKVRQFKGNIPPGAAYRRLYDYWWNIN